MPSAPNLNKLLLGLLGVQLTVAGGAISISVQYGSPWELLIHVGVLVTIAAFFAPNARPSDADGEPADNATVFSPRGAERSENTD